MDEPAITSKDIVMLGNSLTEGGGDWFTVSGKKNVRNRGIIGDEVMGIYDRLHQILPGHPAKLFLLIGVNDISHDFGTRQYCRHDPHDGGTHPERISRHKTLPTKPTPFQ